eukprot:4310465-Pyramimonas_sp.AAC.1
MSTVLVRLLQSTLASVQRLGTVVEPPSNDSAPSNSRLLELKCGLQAIKIKHLQQQLETLQDELSRVKNPNTASGSAPVPRRRRSNSDSSSSKYTEN